MMERVQRPVRDYLRAADIVIDLLNSNGHVSEHEMTMLQAYNARLQTLLQRQQPTGQGHD